MTSTASSAAPVFHSLSSPLHFQDTNLTLIQLGQTSKDKSFNINHARTSVRNAVNHNATGAKGRSQMVVLPECWNSPYGVQYFETYAEDFGGAWGRVKQERGTECVKGIEKIGEGGGSEEEVALKQQRALEKQWTVDGQQPVDVSSSPSETIKMMSELSKELGIVLVGGSVPERDPDTGKLYNTATVFNEQGQLISLHRKLHLFDIDIPGKMTFQESKTLTAGDRITVFECSLGRFGLAICYDLRFPEIATVASRLGAGAIIYPGAFNTTTGPRSWEVLQRARAADNQVYIIACSPARPSQQEMDAGAYPTYGHSMIVNPWAQVVTSLDEKENTLDVSLEKSQVEEVRKFVPIAKQRRFDVYPDIATG